MDAAQVIDRAKAKADATWVFDHPSDSFVVVLAHPGQELNRDPQFLLENFGIAKEHLGRVRKLSESAHRPLDDGEKAAGGGDVDEQIAELEARIESLKASKAAAKPARGKAAADGVESTPAKE